MIDLHSPVSKLKPALVGRTTVLPFLPLGRDVLAGIVDLQIARIGERVRESYGPTLTVSEAAREALAGRAEAGETGARAIEAMIARDVLPRLAAFWIRSHAAGRRAWSRWTWMTRGPSRSPRALRASGRRAEARGHRVQPGGHPAPTSLE